MEVLWALSHHCLQPKKKTSQTGHPMVVALPSSLLTSYTDAARCPPVTSIRYASYGELHFYHTTICRHFLTMLSFAKQSMRHLSGESHGKVLASLTLDRDLTMRLHGWKVHMNFGIETLGSSSRACWRILSFRTSSITRHFDNMMPMVIANMRTLCQAIGLGNRL